MYKWQQENLTVTFFIGHITAKKLCIKNEGTKTEKLLKLHCKFALL